MYEIVQSTFYCPQKCLFIAFSIKKAVIKRVNFNLFQALIFAGGQKSRTIQPQLRAPSLPPTACLGLPVLGCSWLSLKTHSLCLLNILPDQDANISFAFFCLAYNLQNSSSLCSKQLKKFQKRNSMLVALLGYLQAPKETTACVVS